MGLSNNKFRGTFAHVLADGSIRIKVEEGTPGAELRNFKTSDNVEQSVWELVYSEISGRIFKIEFHDGDFGKSMWVFIRDGKDEFVLSLSTANNFGEDLMKKLPNIDFGKDIKFIPYSFEDKKTKKSRKGITVYQGETKIEQYFADAENNPINGIPVPDKESKDMDKDDWKVYFINVRKFLIQFVTDNVIPKVESRPLSADEIQAAAGGEVIDQDKIDVPETVFDNDIKVEDIKM